MQPDLIHPKGLNRYSPISYSELTLTILYRKDIEKVSVFKFYGDKEQLESAKNSLKLIKSLALKTKNKTLHFNNKIENLVSVPETTPVEDIKNEIKKQVQRLQSEFQLEGLEVECKECESGKALISVDGDSLIFTPK